MLPLEIRLLALDLHRAQVNIISDLDALSICLNPLHFEVRRVLQHENSYSVGEVLDHWLRLQSMSFIDGGSSTFDIADMLVFRDEPLRLFHHFSRATVSSPVACVLDQVRHNWVSCVLDDLDVGADKLESVRLSFEHEADRDAVLGQLEVEGVLDRYGAKLAASVARGSVPSLSPFLRPSVTPPRLCPDTR